MTKPHTTTCRDGIQHYDGLVPSYNPAADLAAGTQLYQLTGWIYLLKRCGCRGAPEPPDIYTALTEDQARAWIEERE